MTDLGLQQGIDLTTKPATWWLRCRKCCTSAGNSQLS